MKNYVSIFDLVLTGAQVAGFPNCTVSIQDSDLVCSDVFSRAVVKFPLCKSSRHLHLRGLPEEIGINEDGEFEVWEINYEDEDYFGEEEQPDFILERYSHISTMDFTLILDSGEK